ncbi:hypothetical protein KL938_003224 [Ogataea parapolymorpha]|nr:hypothetical protein KL938_003224 [Ogataea parapolymorpha]
MPNPSSRILKELKLFQSNSTLQLLPSDDLNVQYVDMKILDNPLYPDTFRLRFIIDKDYPFAPPQVQFVRSHPIPIHPHIYSNGHICLNILYDGWTPAHSLHSVALSIQSMLAGNTGASRPEGDERYCATAPSNPLLSRFMFDDDSV